MIARIIVCIILSIMAIGFLWFIAQIIYLGMQEFFKKHNGKKLLVKSSKKEDCK